MELIKVHVKGYTRIDPETGKVEHVKPHEDTRRKAVLPITSPKQGKSPIPVTPTTPQPKAISSPAQQVPDMPVDASIFSQTKSQQRYSILHGSVDSLQALSNDFTTAALTNQMDMENFNTFITKLSQTNPEALTEMYTATKAMESDLLFNNRLPNGESLPLSISHQREARGRLSQIRQSIVNNSDYATLVQLKTDTSISTVKACNLNLTNALIQSVEDDEVRNGLKSIISRAKVHENTHLPFNSEAYKEEIEALFDSLLLNDTHRAVGKLEGLDINLNIAVAQSMFNSNYTPNTKASRIAMTNSEEVDTTSLGRYVTLANAASREYFNNKGVSELTLYKAQPLHKHDPQYKQLVTSTIKNTQNPVVDYNTDVDIEYASKWHSNPNDVKAEKENKGEKTIVLKATVPIHDVITSSHTNKAIKDNSVIIGTKGKRAVSIYKEY